MNTDEAALIERVLGLDFFVGSVEEAAARIALGGLLTAPAAIGLAEDFVRVPDYRRALLESEVVLTDSGFLVNVWNCRTGRRMTRTSGLKFLRHWLARPESRQPRACGWVLPRAEDVVRTRAWLAAQGIATEPEDFYVAPWYGAGSLADEALVAWLSARRPAAVYLGIGGGVQERLGHFLRGALPYRPAILCLGAALAFLTGAQVGIPVWVDRARLGWLWRSMASPRTYGWRYVRSLRLVVLILRHGSEAPPLSGSTQR